MDLLVSSNVALCFLVLLMPVAASGQAGCLSGADLATGIAVTLDNGAIEVYRRAENDSALVNVDGSGETGPGYKLVLAQGILVLSFETVPESDGVTSLRTTYAYPATPVDVPVPSPGARWEVEAVKSDSSGEMQEVQVLQSGALGVLAIGACHYDIIPVTVSYGSDYTEEITYLTDLGFGYLHWYQNSGGDKIVTELLSLERTE